MNRSGFIVNPGTGYVPSARLRDAWKSVRALQGELQRKALVIRRAKEDDGEGRYAFDIVTPDFRRRARLLVPGLPPEKLRLELVTGIPPRFYVDGSSWYYGYAVSAVKDKLTQGYGC